jgi:hypothetical protein
MPLSQARTTIDLLLGSIYYKRAPDRSAHSFIITKPGHHPLSGGLGIELNYDDRTLTTAILYLRQHGATYLGALSVSEVRSFLTSFVSDNFWLIQGEAWLKLTDQSLAQILSENAKQALTNAMEVSHLFVEPRDLTLFPLSVVQVTHPFVSECFFLVPPHGLTESLLDHREAQSRLAPAIFPPFVDLEWKTQPVAAWLGIWAPNPETALRLRSAILGAVSLLPHPMERYMFSRRTLVRGRCTILAGSHQLSMGDPHTPALMQDIIISDVDHESLTLLVSKLGSPTKADKKQIRALEYQYRSWVPDPTRRFPTLFAALDAIYGDAAAATQAIIGAVAPVMGLEYDYDRLKLMLSLRASVIHGGAPNVYESSSYHRYYERYFTDATRDLELIVARCLQIKIFGEVLKERPHTYAVQIKQETGRMV